MPDTEQKPNADAGQVDLPVRPMLERMREAAQGEELFGFDGLRDSPDPLLTEAADEIERLRAVVAEFVAAHDEYNGASGLNGTQQENEAALYRRTRRYCEAWKALRALVRPNAGAKATCTAPRPTSTEET
jgi:hypothetical protein